MLVFVLLTMMMGGAVLLSASLFYLSSNLTHQGTRKSRAQCIGDVVYDDVEFPPLGEPGEKSTGTSYSTQLLDFTRTAHKSANQLPLLGMPDKAFYHIH